MNAAGPSRALAQRWGDQAPRVGAPPELEFAFCTLVTRPEQYAAMVTSARACGFAAPAVPSSEFWWVDNSAGNQVDAFGALDVFAQAVVARYYVLCHQDVLFRFDRAPELQVRLQELDARDRHWALAGNWGGRGFDDFACRLTDPLGADQRRGALPARVQSLDENFVVVHRRFPAWPVGPRMQGFHFCAADLCRRAAVEGRSAWVIDFHLEHLSAGTTDHGWLAARERFIRQASRYGPLGFVQTSTTLVWLTGWPWLSVQLSAFRVLSLVRGMRRVLGWPARTRSGRPP